MKWAAMWRLGLLAVSTILGLGTGAASASASAPTLSVTGTVSCNIDSGHFVVNWYVLQHGNLVGDITDTHIEPAGSTLRGFDYKIFPEASGPQSGGQFVPDGATSATLTIGVDFPGPVHVEGTGTVAITGTCGRVVPTVSFQKQCGYVAVTMSLTGPAGRAAGLEIVQYTDAGASRSVNVRVEVGNPSTLTVPDDWAARIEVTQDGTPVTSTGPLPAPAGCYGGSGGAPGGQPPVTASRSTTSAAADMPPPGPEAQPSAAPTTTATTAYASAPPATTPAPEDADLTRTGLSQPAQTAVFSSVGVVALALVGAFVVVTLRRRRSGHTVIASTPTEPEAENGRRGGSDTGV
jgi:hypothetical protein